MTNEQAAIQSLITAAELRINAHALLFQASILAGDEVGRLRESKATLDATADLLKYKHQAAVILQAGWFTPNQNTDGTKEGA